MLMDKKNVHISHRGADQWQYEARSGLLRHVPTQKCLAVTRFITSLAFNIDPLCLREFYQLLPGSPCSYGCYPASEQTLNKSGISLIIRQVPQQTTSYHYQQSWYLSYICIHLILWMAVSKTNSWNSSSYTRLCDV